MMQYFVLALALLAILGLLYWLRAHPGLFTGMRMPGIPAVSLGGLLYVVAALFGGAVLFRLSRYNWDFERLWNGEPFWFTILGIAILVFAIWKIGVGWVSTTFSTGNFLMQMITSFSVMTAFFFMLSKIYPGAPLFNTSEGFGHLAWYYVLAGLVALVAANLKGKAWFINTALVVLMFALTGHETGRLLDPSGRLSAKIASILSFGGGGDGYTVVASPTTAACDGNPTTLLYNDASLMYPLGDVSCQKRAYVIEGCVSWLDSNGRPLAHTCQGTGMPTVSGITHLQPDPEAVVISNRCRAFAPGNLVEKCA